MNEQVDRKMADVKSDVTKIPNERSYCECDSGCGTQHDSRLDDGICGVPDSRETLLVWIEAPVYMECKYCDDEHECRQWQWWCINCRQCAGMLTELQADRERKAAERSAQIAAGQLDMFGE